ncbi:MAG: homocysteine S-methyltransferase family protein [Coriobacteriales bacterium]
MASAFAGESYLLFDGAYGTLLQQAHIKEADTLPELLALNRPELITSLHRAYVEAGADVITLDTFGANAAKLGDEASVEQVFAAAAKCARDAGAPLLAAEIGPLMSFMKPTGTVSFDEAYGYFAEEARAGEAAGADLFIIETMTDLAMCRAALLAVHENCSLPVIALMTFDENGHTLAGNTPAACARVLSGMGADAIGMNCTLTPSQAVQVVKEIVENSTCPVCAQPNAGKPDVSEGIPVYDMSPDGYAGDYRELLDSGVGIVGSCCGTTPEYTKALRDEIDKRAPAPRSGHAGRFIASAREVIELTEGAEAVEGFACLLNPDGKVDAGALSTSVLAAMTSSARVMELDLTNATETQAAEAVQTVQMFSAKPLWLTAADPAVLEEAVRVCVGLPLVSLEGDDAAINGKLMERLALHYGCVTANG